VTDAAGIGHVYLAGWQQSHAGLVSPEYITCVRARAREEFWRAELQVEAPDRMPWVALIDARVVGFAIGGLSRDADADTRTGEVYQVYVDPDCWGQGIGSGLLRHVVRDLSEHGFERVDLWIIEGDTTARAFVEKHGWSTDGATRLEDCGGAQVEQVRFRHLLR
jgi:GNAT superfamily N-acetyltransferase